MKNKTHVFAFQRELAIRVGCALLEKRLPPGIQTGWGRIIIYGRVCKLLKHKEFVLYCKDFLLETYKKKLKEMKVTNCIVETNQTLVETCYLRLTND